MILTDTERHYDRKYQILTDSGYWIPLIMVNQLPLTDWVVENMQGYRILNDRGEVIAQSLRSDR